MSAPGYDPRCKKSISDSVARDQQAKAIHDRSKTLKSKTPGLVQYPGQVDQHHSLSGAGNGRRKK